MKVFEEVCADELLVGTHVMYGRWVDTMKTPTVWRSKYTQVKVQRNLTVKRVVLQQQSKAFVCFWQVISNYAIRDTKLLWQTTLKLFSTLKSATEKNFTRTLTGGHRNFCWTDGVWYGKCAKPCWACEHLRIDGKFCQERMFVRERKTECLHRCACGRYASCWF